MADEAQENAVAAGAEEAATEESTSVEAPAGAADGAAEEGDKSAAPEADDTSNAQEEGAAEPAADSPPATDPAPDAPAGEGAEEQGDGTAQQEASEAAVTEDAAQEQQAEPESEQEPAPQAEPQAEPESEQTQQPEQDPEPEPPQQPAATTSQSSAPGKLPESMQVSVDIGPDLPPKQLHISIVDQRSRKPFIGGYRHKKTGVEYHHVSVQTEREKKQYTGSILFHRETQTAVFATRSAQNVRESSTQMPRKDLVVDESGDYAIRPREYFDSEQWAKLRLSKTIVIQCYARGMFARTRARKLRSAVADARIATVQAEREAQAVAAQKRDLEIQRRMHPSSKEDFEVLYDELEMWRLQELEKIRSVDVDSTTKQAGHYNLLMKELKLVQTIDRLKADAVQKNRDQQIMTEIDAMAAPKLWEMSDGKVAEVHTPFTTRARELRDLYAGLRAPDLTIDERLDVLMNVKWTVKEFDVQLSAEISELVDREADLISRGRGEKFLAGLRKRINKLFLEFINTPEYNPEAAKFSKTLLYSVPDMQDLRKRMPKMLVPRDSSVADSAMPMSGQTTTTSAAT